MANETSRDRLNPENFSGPSRRFFTEEIRQNKRESAQNLSNANTLNRQRAKQHNDVYFVYFLTSTS